MKIVNIALNGDYTDGFSYHENLLPKYHKKNGHDVYVIASEYIFDKNGQEVKTHGDKDYIDENGVHIIRLPIKKNKHIGYKFKRFEGVYETIKKIQPDIIFCHLFQFIDVLEIIKYKKLHPEIKLYLDSHADYSNSAHTWLSKYVLHGILWKYCAHKALPLAEKFYGVLPARVDFLIERYKLPKNKVELLVMGADDELVEQANNPDIIRKTREEHSINKDDFLIVTGGKIDLWKKQTLLLMDAVNNIEAQNIKLMIFGSIVPELQEEVTKRCSDKVQYIGWLEAKDTYPIFAASQLVVFPGRHSVFWEQVCGQGKPMIVKKWKGTTHVDIGGNIEFLTSDSVLEIQRKIENIFYDTEKYKGMLDIAKCEGAKKFSYNSLAQKSIELFND